MTVPEPLPEPQALPVEPTTPDAASMQPFERPENVTVPLAESAAKAAASGVVNPTVTPLSAVAVAPRLIEVEPMVRFGLARFAFGKRPVTPVVSGNPVAFVRTAETGVPSAGVTKVGPVASTAFPEPVVPPVSRTLPDPMVLI